jgi:hypothetical protein
MTIYEEILKSIQDYKSAKRHLTSLGKFYYRTEDQLLKKNLYPVLQFINIWVESSKDTTPKCLAQVQAVPIKKLVKYLGTIIPSKKPEWQIIALRESWIPPQS